MTPEKLEAVAVEVALAAADHVRPHLGRVGQVATKSSATDVVTQLDLESEQLIIDALQAATPGARVLAEEAGVDASAGGGAASGVEWVVDPLDGTVNYLYGLPVVAVSIAAAVDGEVVAGAVADVVGRRVFSAHRGGGAHCEGAALMPSACDHLAMALVGTGYSYDAELRQAQGAVVQRLLPAARDVRCLGSAALNCCWVGAGHLDAYFECDLKVWDYSAGALIAAEAGAVVELPCPENHDTVLIAAPAIFEPLRAILLP